MNAPQIIQGGNYKDHRGQVTFNNQFDLTPIKRMYFTEHFSTDAVRAWQAHDIERRWFVCAQGAFEIKLVAIDNFSDPSDNLEVLNYRLESENGNVLCIPKGYANGFRALENNSKLMIFSDYEFGANPNDQYRFDKSKWTVWN